MASAEGDIEGGEVLLIVAVVGFGLYFVGNLLKSLNDKTGIFTNTADTGLVDNVVCALNTQKTVVGAQIFVGSNQALTAAQARSIANFAGLSNSYQISPDGLQVWFPDGSYYDNTTGTFFNKQGVSIGSVSGGLTQQISALPALPCSCPVVSN